MRLVGIVKRLIATLVVAGFVLVPLSAPGRAQAADREIMAVDHEAMAVDHDTMMAGADMPCCPHDQMPMDAEKCLFMTICLCKCFQAVAPVHAARIVAISFLAAALPANDVVRDGLGHSPPSRPPRSLMLPA